MSTRKGDQYKETKGKSIKPQMGYLRMETFIIANRKKLWVKSVVYGLNQQKLRFTKMYHNKIY